MSTKNQDSKTETLCGKANVVPMLHQIAKLIDELVENGKEEDVSDIIELMKDVVDDNWMYVRN